MVRRLAGAAPLIPGETFGALKLVTYAIVP